MVQLREIFDKLGPDLGFADKILDYDIGDYDFDTMEQTSILSMNTLIVKIQI